METQILVQPEVDETVLSEKQLAECVNNIRTLHTQATEFDRICEDQGKKSMETAAAAGSELIKAKKLVKHGQWGNWIETNFAFTQKTAENYMALANPKYVSILEECYSLRQAYSAIRDMNAKQKGAKTTSSDSKTSGKKQQKAKPVKEHVENLVKKLNEIIFTNGNQDNGDIIVMLQPLAALYNEYMERHPLKNLERRPSIDLNLKTVAIEEEQTVNE